MGTELGESDAGSRHRVRVGERVTVRLPETPTTGYRWEVLDPDPRLELVDDRFEGTAEPRGAAGVRVLVFEPAAAGVLGLRLVRRRRWGGGEPVDDFSVEVDARD